MSVSNVQDIYELSPLQQGMLFATLYAPEAALYVEQITLGVEGELDERTLQRAWQEVLNRQTALRTSFHWEGLEKPVQVVHQVVELPWRSEDWSEVPAEVQHARLSDLVQADLARGFNLADAPLLRITLVRLTDATYRLLLTFHHLILDGWSFQAVLAEASACYEAFIGGRRPGLEPCRPYGDYIAWVQQQDVPRSERFWRRVLDGYSGPPSLGVDQAQPSRAPGTGSHHQQQVYIPRETTSALVALARRHQLTLNTVFQAAWAVLLSRYSGESDIVFGATMSGRPAALRGVESMVGLFINTLPVRAQVAADAPLVSLLRHLLEHQFEAQQYEYTPLANIQEWSDVPLGQPLFETLVVFENYPVPGASARRTDAGPSDDSTDSTWQEPDVFGRVHYPLGVLVSPGPELHVQVLYMHPRFAHDTIERMLGHLQQLLQNIAARPDSRIGDLELMTPKERHLLLEWNATSAPYPADSLLHELFEAYASRAPDAVAIITGNQQRSLSFRELDERANQLAHHLQSLGVGPDAPVGVCLERSPELVVSLLAILKAGGAYLPLDPSYPAERLRFMLHDAAAVVVITEERLAEHVRGGSAHLVRLDADSPTIAAEATTAVSSATHALHADHLAYIIYTSGSTGSPKGVGVPQRQLLNRFQWMWDVYPFAPGEVGCQKTTINFVDSIWELLGPLLRGVPVVMVPQNALTDLDQLIEILSAHAVSRMWVVPSLLQLLLDSFPDLQRRVPSLTFWVTSGEPISPSLARRFAELLPDARLLNLYGTSEVFDATVWEVTGLGPDDTSVPIGQPIANVQTYVLDARGRPQPIGVPGELHVGGVGLARGYLNRPDLTAERFVQDPFSQQPGARLYRTGDLVRWRADGLLEFLGRLDHQINIRGYRIEPGEVESALVSHPTVRQSAVALRDDERLVAYIVPVDGRDRGPLPTGAELRQYLRARLPDYMLPSTFVLLDALPLTPNGKLNRAALPAPDEARPDLGSDFIAPRTEVERVLAGIWSELLSVEQVGIHDNFFELGGHSLQGTRLVSRLREALKVELPLRSLFDAPTVARLAEIIEAAKKSNERPAEHPIPSLSRERTLRPVG